MSAAVLAVAATVAVGVASQMPGVAQAVAGTPGTPGTATILFTENFENNSTTTVSPPVLITAYVGASGETYSASPFFASASSCNGMILAPTSAPATVTPDLCAGSGPSWNALRYLSGKLSKAFSPPGDQFTVASYTAGSGTAPDDYLQLKTNTPIALPSGGAYLTASIDTGAYNCSVGAPNYFMYLTDAAGVRHSVVAAGINPCQDPDAIRDSSIDGRTALLVRTAGDAPQLIDSTSVAIEIENQNVNGLGNDATFDNIQLLDVSPQLDKTFESPIPYGTTSTVTFTITNTYSPAGDGSLTQLDPKPGWSFTDQLPAGLTIVGTPTTGAGAEACANFDGSGTTGTSVSAAGDLSAGQSYCTVFVEVRANAPGSYTNVPSDVTTVGLVPPADAVVTFVANPSISLIKSSTLNDVNDDAIANVGDTIDYTFTLTNTGNIPLIDVVVTDPFVGSLTCPATTIAVGGSMVCASDVAHSVTQAEVDSGAVPNTASATAANSFDPASTVSANSSIATALAPAARLRLVKRAGVPVDTNSSGLVDAGDTIGYTFTVTNTGNVTIADLAVADAMAGAVTCSSTTLAPGTTTDCAADSAYTVTDDDELAGSVMNTASVAGTAPNGTTVVSNTDSTTTAVSTPSPRLSIVKTADAPVDVNSSGLTDAGDTIQYRFTVGNTGNVPLSGIAITDDLIGAATCGVTTLAPGASTACTADVLYTVTAADETVGSIVNIATASGVDPDGGPVSSPADSTATPVATPVASLVLDKIADPAVDVNASGLVDAGDTVQYRFVVTNNGNVPISALTISDTLAGPVTCGAVDLAPGASTNCSADSSYVVTEDDEVNGMVSNTATASGLDPDNAAVTSKSATTSTAVATPIPSLVIDKSADDPVDVNTSGIVDAGDTIRYHFTVANNGNVPITLVGVTDALAGQVTCQVTTLAPGASTACTADAVYTVTETNETAGSVVNTATASGVDPDGGGVTTNADSTTSAVTAPNPSLTLVKTADTPVDVNSSGLTDAGDTIRYTFTVTNSGNVPVTAVSVTDDLVGNVTCPTTRLAVGDVITCAADGLYTVTVADEAAGSVDNTATASGADPDGGAVESSPDSTSTPTAIPAPALTLVKSAGTPVDVNSSGLVDAGDTIAYDFTVENTGNVPISSLRIDDPRVGLVRCELTNLAVGGTTSCSGTSPYVITNADETAGQADNAATAYGTSPDNISVPSNTSTTSTPVATPSPSLAIVKTADPTTDVNSSGLIDAGDTIQYRFVVTNTGNVPVADVGVVDDLVGPVTCVTTDLAVGASTNCVADTEYTVSDTDEEAGSVLNVAEARSIDPDGGTVISASDNSIVGVTAPAPSLAIAKTHDAPADVNSSGLVDAGDTIQYRFVVTNTGNVPLRAVDVTDDLVGSVACAATSLAVGQSTDCAADAVYVVDVADEAVGQVVNTASADGVDPDGGAVASLPDSTTTGVATPAPSLVIDKSADSPVDVNSSGLVDAGDTIQYRFVVTNNGNVPLTDVGVIDEMAGSVACAATALGVGESTDCRADAVYTITEADEANGVVINMATGNGTDPDGRAVASTTATTSTAVETPAPSLIIDKVADPPVDVNSSGMVDAGDTIRYTFTITNTGNVPLVDVGVDDELAGTATCEQRGLAIGESTMCVADAPYVVTEADEAAGGVTNVAAARAADPDGANVTSPTDSTSSVVQAPAPSLSLDKIAETPVDVNRSGLVGAGDTIVYRFVVTNTGTVPLANVVVNDDLIGPVTCESVTLAVGETTECIADATYPISAADEVDGVVNNTAAASAVDPDGQSVASPPDSTTTAVAVPRPSLFFEKHATEPTDVNGSGITDGGDVIRYSFTVTNNGNVPITDVVVTDDLVGAVTCSTTELSIGQSTECVADVDYSITEADQNRGSVDNIASASGAAPDGARVLSDTDSTAAPVQAPVPMLGLVKEATTVDGATSTGPFGVGDQVQFRFTVTNTGNVNITDLRIDDAMIGPSTCDDTALAVGASTLCGADDPYTVTDADLAAGSITNTATARAVAVGDMTQSTSAPSSVTITVQPRPKPPTTGGGFGRPVGLAGALSLAGIVLVITAGTWRRRTQSA